MACPKAGQSAIGLPAEISDLKERGVFKDDLQTIIRDSKN